MKNNNFDWQVGIEIWVNYEAQSKTGDYRNKIITECLDATQKSIEKWEKILAETDIDKGPRNCPLCHLYCDNACEKCFIKEITGDNHCRKFGIQEWVNNSLNLGKNNSLFFERKLLPKDHEKRLKSEACAKNIIDGLKEIYDDLRKCLTEN